MPLPHFSLRKYISGTRKYKIVKILTGLDIIDFQNKHGLKPDGLLGKKTIYTFKKTNF
jgi:peptidoglycan hydrolase-like protein with peptidoglycan-binding domain